MNMNTDGMLSLLQPLKPTTFPDTIEYVIWGQLMVHFYILTQLNFNIPNKFVTNK